ncbi:MAG: methyl-accepting chemotaxis protein [Bryobacteraceae bacterium]
MRTQRTTIGTKILAAMLAIIVLALLSDLVALRALGSLGSALDISMNQTARRLATAAQIRTLVYQIRFAQRGISLGLFEKRPADTEKAVKLFTDSIDGVQTLIAEFRTLVSTDADKRALDEIGRYADRWKQIGFHMVQLAEAGDTGGLSHIRIVDARTLGDDIDGCVKLLLTNEQEFMNRSIADSRRTSSQTFYTQLGLAILMLLAGALVVVMVRRLSSLLRHIASEMKQGAEQVQSAASQVASAGQSLAQSSSELAASVQQSSESTEQISSMTQKNAGNSQSAADVMTAVDRQVQEGNRTIEQMVSSMNEVNASGAKISKIIKAIDEIAFQTNILALNAAVEAARAGEAGMGFAVVADEVRNLSQRSAQAAHDTAALIEESITKTKDGTARTHQVAEVIQAITESAAKVKTMVEEVNAGSQEQVHGLAQISKAVSKIDGVAQNTAASAEETASASQQLSAQASSMLEIAVQLRTLVGVDA